MMKNIKNAVPAILTFTALVTTVTLIPSAQAECTSPNTGPIALSNPRPIKGDNWRGKAFYEILFMYREANGSGVGNYFNSLGNTFHASNEVMDSRFRSLNAETLKKKYGCDGVFFNGPRRFVANGFTGMAWDGHKKRVIGTIPFNLDGTFEVPSFQKFVSGPPVAYKVLVSKRTNTFSYKAGEQIHELITPKGEVYTMFSLSLKSDPENTIENLPTLGKRLTLPAGWKYRMRTLKNDLVLSSNKNSNPPNSIVLDQFENNYQHNPSPK